MKKILSLSLACSLFWSVYIYADPAPVEDLSEQNTQQMPYTTLSAAKVSTESASNQETLKQRVEHLEQQINNIANMNFYQKIEELRQKIQELNGRLQVEQHDVEVLKNQQRSFYQDINSRLQHKQKFISPMTANNTIMKKNTTLISTTSESTERKSYRMAFNLLLKRRYHAALKAFQTYQHQYPHEVFTPNADYWMGELFLKQRDSKKASQWFQRLILEHPKSSKVPDAKLKLALIHLHANKTTVQVRQELNAIKQQYPNSTAAQLASIQLQRMKD